MASRFRLCFLVLSMCLVPVSRARKEDTAFHVGCRSCLCRCVVQAQHCPVDRKSACRGLNPAECNGIVRCTGESLDFFSGRHSPPVRARVIFPGPCRRAGFVTKWHPLRSGVWIFPCPADLGTVLIEQPRIIRSQSESVRLPYIGFRPHKSAYFLGIAVLDGQDCLDILRSEPYRAGLYVAVIFKGRQCNGDFIISGTACLVD